MALWLTITAVFLGLGAAFFLLQWRRAAFRLQSASLHSSRIATAPPMHGAFTDDIDRGEVCAEHRSGPTLSFASIRSRSFWEDGEQTFAADARASPADRPILAVDVPRDCEPTRLDISTNDMLAWEVCWGVRHRIVNGRLEVDGAIRSGVGLRAEPGASYRCEYAVRCANDPSNGLPMTYYAGPITLNDKGQIVQSFIAQAPLTAASGVHYGDALIEAAEDAHTIFIGLQGPTGDSRADTRPQFEWVRLFQV